MSQVRLEFSDFGAGAAGYFGRRIDWAHGTEEQGDQDVAVCLGSKDGKDGEDG